MEVGAKTNEITTVPELIDTLDVAGAMISVDALNTQKEIAKKIIDAKAQYTLALKGNHKTLNEEVGLLFDTMKICNSSHFEETDKGHGRVTTRVYDVICVDALNLPQIAEWKGLIAVGRVHSKTHSNAKETSETRHYLLSYNDVQLFAKSARGHWGVESMHWVDILGA